MNTVEAVQGAMEVEAEGMPRVLAILTAPASPPSGQWFEDEGRTFSLQDFAYLVGQQMSDVNRRTGATEVWLVKDVQVLENYLVAQRQRMTGARGSGPWLGPYHVRDIAVNHWLSSTLGKTALAVAPLKADLKKPDKKGLPNKSVSTASAVSALIQKGTKRWQEIALRRREADPLAIRGPVQFSYFDNTNTRYRNSDSFMSSLIFATPKWAAGSWPVLTLDSPSYHPFLRLDTRPWSMRMPRRHRGDAWLAMDLSPRALAASLGDSIRADVRQATTVPGRDVTGNQQWPHSVLLYQYGEFYLPISVIVICPHVTYTLHLSSSRLNKSSTVLMI